MSRDFLPLVLFHESVSPPAPEEYPIRTVSNFFQNSLRFSQVKVHHRYQRNRHGKFQIFSQICGDIRKSRCTTGINDTGGKICYRYHWQRRQILPPVLLVLLITVANFSPVSTTMVAICHRYQPHRRQITTSVNDTGGK